jgi:ketosteroid isomerase-like protein
VSDAPPHPPELQRLLDQEAIHRKTVRYARAIDRMDWELLRSCYHPDAIDRHGAYDGDIDGFVEWLKPLLPAHESTTHFLGNQEIDVEGDVAFAETLCIATQRDAGVDGGPPVDKTLIVRYCDRFERRAGAWRIAHRVVVYEPGRVDEVTPTDWDGNGIRAVSPGGLMRPGPVSG